VSDGTCDLEFAGFFAVFRWCAARSASGRHAGGRHWSNRPSGGQVGRSGGRHDHTPGTTIRRPRRRSGADMGDTAHLTSERPLRCPCEHRARNGVTPKAPLHRRLIIAPWSRALQPRSTRHLATCLDSPEGLRQNPCESSHSARDVRISPDESSRGGRWRGWVGGTERLLHLSTPAPSETIHQGPARLRRSHETIREGGPRAGGGAETIRQGCASSGRGGETIR
jgi:hypothetical protein